MAALFVVISDSPVGFSPPPPLKLFTRADRERERVRRVASVRILGVCRRWSCDMVSSFRDSCPAPFPQTLTSWITVMRIRHNVTKHTQSKQTTRLLPAGPSGHGHVCSVIVEHPTDKLARLIATVADLQFFTFYNFDLPSFCFKFAFFKISRWFPLCRSF